MLKINVNKESRDIFFGYGSFSGTILTIIFLIYSAYKSDVKFDVLASFLALCLMNLFLACSAIFIVRKYDKLHQLNSQSDHNVASLQKEIEILHSGQKVISKVMHNINHEARILIQQINSTVVSNGPQGFKEIEGQFKQYILFLLENVKEIFDVITEDQCSTCIKIIIPDEKNHEQSFIKTHFRDSISYRERNAVDSELPIYPYYENTAFKKIINKDYPDTYYFCNDLKNEKSYNNRNTNWQKFYNACLVVPISLPTRIDGKNSKIMIGFICVDNFAGGFDDLITHNLLSAIADLNFLVFSSFSELKESFDKESH